MKPPASSGKGGGAGAPTATGGRGPQDPGARQGSIALHVTVSGHVQGVFFRDTCARRARAEGVAGWVRNRADGRVEVWFEGHPQAVENMLIWCREGPPQAEVTGVAVSDVEPASLDAFRIE
ncbi:MAG TPA: acylphosphatase [Acidimicrobiales bacterium]|nr:acylphosphatase [Acidimicrobiales bacterium]